jgi:hypothetical protein
MSALSKQSFLKSYKDFTKIEVQMLSELERFTLAGRLITYPHP